MRKGVALPNRTKRFTLQERKQVVKICGIGKKVEVRINGSPGVTLLVLPRSQAEIDEHQYKFRVMNVQKLRQTDTETRKWVQLAEVGVPLSELIILHKEGRLCPAA